MGEETGIAWTNHTFNPWHGCQRVSPGCENCYAESFNKFRHGGTGPHWGPLAPRRFFGDKHWNEPRKWNRDAEVEGVRHRVFCASMADVFENRRDLDGQRDRLWSLIAETPHLDWQLLTKRPENLARMLPWMPCPDGIYCRASLRDGVVCAEDECDNDNGVRGKPWPNVWIGTTVEDQQRADERIPHLLRTPAAVRFLSCEPLLGPVDLRRYFSRPCVTCNGSASVPAPGGGKPCPRCFDVGQFIDPDQLGWVIVGGESGNGARPMRLKWARDLIEQCRSAGVPVFFKQAGEKPMIWRSNFTTRLLNANARKDAPEGFVVLKVSGKGGDISELPGGPGAWPREFPEAAR